MTSTLIHRGPDDSGYWMDDDAGLVFGHRRLAVIDLSPAGAQPMHSECGRYVLVFNGEIYNFHQLRAQLIEHRNWRGTSDTEVVLAAIGAWGVRGAIQQFNGMFALALWDRRERTLTLARDRLGEKPLYYGWMGRTLVFGSELKALRQHPDWRGQVSRQALELYIRHNYVPDPFSIYEGVAKLRPATLVTLDAKALANCATPAQETYWSSMDVFSRSLAGARHHGDEALAMQELDQLLRDAVRLRMEADVPLGAFLSGGIDSSIVVAMMQAQSQRAVRTFSIGFDETGFDEAQHARRVAQHLGTDHTEYYVGPEEAMNVVPLLPSLYDEPFADSSQIPTFLVSRMARQHVTVALSGDGGDELFGGYERYQRTQAYWRKIAWLPRRSRQRLGRSLATLSPAVLDRLFTWALPLLRGYGHSAPVSEKVQLLSGALAVGDELDFYRRQISCWRNPEQVMAGGGSGHDASHNGWSEAALNAPLGLKMMYTDLVGYLPGDILVKLDRASMGVSLESRLPLLDHRVVEFAWSLPLDMKIRGGVGKWILKRLLHQYVPAELVDRPKMGFAVPIDAWLRGPLRSWAMDLLDESRLRDEGFFDVTRVKDTFEQHVAGSRTMGPQLWGILMFQSWLASTR